MSTSDRELLELAAKAAGITLIYGEKYYVGGNVYDFTHMCYVKSDQPDAFPAYWSPLTDDGDALRLAVKVGIDITFYNGYQEVHADSASCDQLSPAIEEYGEDRFAATRRAIVRAAAEIGKAM